MLCVYVCVCVSDIIHLFTNIEKFQFCTRLEIALVPKVVMPLLFLLFYSYSY